MTRARALLCTSLLVPTLLAAVPPAVAQDAERPPSDSAAASGGAEYGAAEAARRQTVPGRVARLVGDYAAAPEEAPQAVKEAIWAANDIVGMPYRYGGGHTPDFVDDGYDCSGTVSFALHGGGLLKRPRDSRSFARYGAAGRGRWITIWTNPGHAYVEIAGLRLDTSAAGDPEGGKGPRWRPPRTSHRGFRARHPVRL